jgi:CubicO group peptidase (beta-lactamase class C family)
MAAEEFQEVRAMMFRSALVALALTIVQSSAFAETPLSSPQCREFIRFATQPDQSLTDGLVVLKNGQLVYEYYDRAYGPFQPHILWSISKTITGALTGIAVRDGRLSLDQSLSDFFPAPHPSAAYASIHLKNLLYMDSGFEWDEFDTDLSANPVIHLLDSAASRDMAAYVTSLPVTQKGAGSQWRYSTGTTTLLNATLKKVYSAAEYERLPWTELFEPLGMTSAVFERDGTGAFVGGAYSYATPRDLAKLGQLFLNRGKWDGKTILPEDWIDRMLTPSPGFVTGDVGNPKDADGVYGGSIWLNRSLGAGHPKPFPSMPENMHLAVGHEGQLLIMLPSQGIVIARTAHDPSYTHKVDALASRAVSCFADANWPIGRVKKIPAEKKPGMLASLRALKKLLRADLLQNSIAKGACSCTLVSGVDLQTCLDRSNIEGIDRFVRVTTTETSRGIKQVQVGLTWIGRQLARSNKIATAEYDPKEPQWGCTLKY